jgi:hypothetical protein
VVPTAILPDFEVREVERRDLSALQVEEDVLDDLEPGFRRDIEHAQEFMNLV